MRKILLSSALILGCVASHAYGAKCPTAGAVQQALAGLSPTDDTLQTALQAQDFKGNISNSYFKPIPKLTLTQEGNPEYPHCIYKDSRGEKIVSFLLFLGQKKPKS